MQQVISVREAGGFGDIALGIEYLQDVYVCGCVANRNVNEHDIIKCFINEKLAVTSGNIYLPFVSKCSWKIVLTAFVRLFLIYFSTFRMCVLIKYAIIYTNDM